MNEPERAHLADEGVGYLEMRDYNKARWAYELSHPASPFMQWLRTAGNVSFAVEDIRVDSSTVPSIPIPATKLAHDEIARISLELNKWPGVEEAANDKFGASLLIDLGREVATAAHRWPMEDKPRRIVYLRCGGCGLLTLVYRPPRWAGDELKADCSNRCGFELVGEELALSIAMVLEEEKVRRKAAGKVAKSA